MDEVTFQKIMGIYESQIKQRILNFLDVYQELSLTDLSIKLGKSKSTVSKHVKEMQNITYDGKSFINVREQKHRGSIKQKLFSRNNTPLFWGRTYEDIKNFKPEEMYKYLRNDEFLINLRFFSLIKDVISQTIEHINQFYSNLGPKDFDENFKENVYRYDTCIPRIMYYSKEEYLDYREKFLEFDNNYLAEVEEKRKKDPVGSKKPREYMVTHTLIPIKRILDKEFY